MGYPLPHASVPVVDPKTGIMSEPWFLYFAKETDIVAAIDPVGSSSAAANAHAASAETIALQAIGRRVMELQRGPANGPLLVRPPVSKDSMPAIPPVRRQWSITKVIPGTEAAITDYDPANNPESLYVATDTFKLYYSHDGAAWTQIAFISDTAYGPAWDGVAYLAPSQNAVYDALSGIIGRWTPLFDHFVDAGNVGTGEDDLYSDALAAGQFSTNGDKVLGEYGGIFVLSATATRRLRLYFGGTLIFDTGALSITGTNASWDVWVDLIRVDAATVRCSVTLNTSSAALAAYSTYTEVTGLTLADPQILKITGEAAGVGAATNDIVAKLGFVAYSKAA